MHSGTSFPDGAFPHVAIRRLCCAVVRRALFDLHSWGCLDAAQFLRDEDGAAAYLRLIDLTGMGGQPMVVVLGRHVVKCPKRCACGLAEDGQRKCARYFIAMPQRSHPRNGGSNG